MKRNRLWSGILAAVMAAAMMGQTVSAQNLTAETKVQEEVTAAEVSVTGIRMEGNAYNSKVVWTTGDVLSDDTSVFVNVVQGMNLMVSYSDGSEAKLEGSVTEWAKKGVKAVVKDKSTGDVIEMVRQAILPGTYEAFLNYQGFSCKAADFTIKPIEEEVQATITTGSEVAVHPEPYRKTIMKFVADKPGNYTFQAVREDDPDYKYYMELKNAKSESVASQNGTSLFTFLEAGTYYLKVRGDYAFTLSVKEQTSKITGITAEGSAVYNTWSVGDVRANVLNIMTNVVQGMDVMQVFEDGTKAKISNTPSQLIAAGVTVTLKNKDTGSTVALGEKVLSSGNYEVFLNYQDFECKARDFTIKSLEEAVNATITTKSNTAVYSASNKKTVTKFVADKPGYYIFQAATEENPGWKFNIQLLNAKGEYAGNANGTSLLKFLEAGTYYLKVTSSYAFTVSVEEKEEDITGITVSGSAIYNTWSEGDVNASESGILVNVVQGMDVMQILEDGMQVKLGNSSTDLIDAGVSVTLKDKGTGSTVDLDGKRLPAGSYEVILHYQGYECKAMEFAVQKIEEAVTGSIDLKKNSVDYAADSNLYRKTVTKFVADKPGYYIFQADVKGNPNAETHINLYNEDVSYQKSSYSAEPMQVFLKAGTYYVKIVKGDAHTVSVTGKELKSMDLNMEAPEETERLFLIDDIEKWRDVAGIEEENVNSVYNRTKVQLEYKDGTRETRRLSELIREWNFVDWGERIWNIMTGEPGGTTSDPLNIGIYELCYWSDTSETMTDENVDLDYNFIIYKGFQDVSLTDWFVYPVAYTSAAGMMTGMGDGTNFGPAENLSRAQFATILYRMEGSPEVDYKEVFPDVKDGEFYTDAVLWANENDIVTGYVDSGTFGPADHITLEQMAVMMYRFAQYKKYDVKDSTELDSFPDHEKVSEFAEAAVKWASATGLIRGDQGNINPQGNASRAQCATIMMRFSEMYRN